MMQLFRKGSNVVTTAVDVMADTVEDMASLALEAPLSQLPCVTQDSPGSIGDDVNLPLLVKELGARKKLKLDKRKADLLKELEKIDKELIQLDVLLTAANSL